MVMVTCMFSDAGGGYSCKLKRRYFVVHDTNSPKRGSMELALCQYSNREGVKVRARTRIHACIHACLYALTLGTTCVRASCAVTSNSLVSVGVVVQIPCGLPPWCDCCCPCADARTHTRCWCLWLLLCRVECKSARVFFSFDTSRKWSGSTSRRLTARIPSSPGRLCSTAWHPMRKRLLFVTRLVGGEIDS